MRRALLAATAGAVALVVGVVTAIAGERPDARRSGTAFMGPALQAMQRDDASNPGMLWVAEGEALWRRKAGEADRSCADCHGDATATMRGVAARHPAWDATAARPFALGDRIEACRVRHQKAAPLGPETETRLALETWVAFQSRGLPIASSTEPRLEPFRAAGERLYRQRIGQLDLACTQCHDERAGQRLAGSTIPEAHPTGYPIYRLEWQGMGSLERRIRGCMAGVRAEPLADGAIETVELELFLKQRAAGLPVETPAVRP